MTFLDFCLSIEGRGMSEISAWSMIFGVWPQKHISVKLWASATRVAENMAQNTILIEKMASFKQKWLKIEISNFDILICAIMKNHEKNDLGVIVFTKSFVWHHTPKIIDQSEISATLRANKNMIVADISKNWKILISFFDFCLSIERRGMSEISAWSIIFGVWYQKHIFVKVHLSIMSQNENMSSKAIFFCPKNCSNMSYFT